MGGHDAGRAEEDFVPVLAVQVAGTETFHDADGRPRGVGAGFRDVDTRAVGEFELVPGGEGEGEHALVGEEDEEGISDRGELVREVAFRFEPKAAGDEVVQAVDPFQEGGGQGADGAAFQVGGVVEEVDPVLKIPGAALLVRQFGLAGGDQTVEFHEPGDAGFQPGEGFLEAALPGGGVPEAFPGGFQLGLGVGQGFPGGGDFGSGAVGGFDPFVRLFQLT